METVRDPAGIRLWPGFLIVTLQWLAVFGIGMVQPATIAHGLGMMIGSPLGLLLILLWWGLSKPVAKRDRLLGVVLILASLAATIFLAHPSLLPMSIIVYTLPVVCLTFVVTLALTRSWSDAGRRLAWILAIVVSAGIWILIRSDGVDGDMQAQLQWRWQATPEQELVESAEEIAALTPPSGPAPQTITTPEADLDEVVEEAEVDTAPTAESQEPGEDFADSAESSDSAESGSIEQEETLATLEETAASEPTEPEAEWPGFRGIDRSGVISGLQIATDWQASPPEELWRQPVGPGWGSFVVAGDHLYTQEQRGDDEVVSAYRADTGEPVWRHRDGVRFWEALAGAGPRGTPELRDGRLYTFGATGILNALDATTGAKIWSRDVATDTAAPLPEWGFSSSPLVVGDQVVVYTGASEGKGVAAYDIATGEPRWYAPSGPMGYSSVHLATLHGVPQLLVLHKDGLTSHRPEDGEVLWDHGWPSTGARCVQPAFAADGDPLIGTGFGQGLRRVDLQLDGDTWSAEEQWTTTRLKPYYNDFVVHEGHAYGFDGRILASIDLENGELRWKGGRYGNGQLLLLRDQSLLLVLTDRGEVTLVSAEPDGFSELARMKAIGGKTWNHPVVANGVLYLRNGEEMAAFQLPVTSQVASR